MRPSQLVPAINCLIDAKQPVMIHGSPGAGKSDIVQQIAKQRKIDLLDVRLAHFDSVDLRGVPSVDARKRQTTWNTPDFFPTTGKGLLFLDEITSAPQSTQAAAYQLVLDRKLGDYTLPDGWDIIAAGNRITDRAIVNPMSSALKNRFVHLEFDVHTDDWCSWALKAGISIEVLGFIRFRPMLLNEFEKRNNSKEEMERLTRMKNLNAFATPRTWEFVSNISKQNPPKDIEYELYSGVIGEAVAAEFMGYMKYYRDLPNLDALLMNPEKAKVPEEPATLYALATGLATKATKDNLERVVKYLLRIPPEFQVLSMKDAISRDESLTNTKTFHQWSLANSDVLF